MNQKWIKHETFRNYSNISFKSLLLDALRGDFNAGERNFEAKIDEAEASGS